ncbi:hypothetical protein TNCV_1634121 [Trichonephila clavipes]|nr:hypothetical protein TNCV_1634121 [Trichonephila clavipes]
MKSPVVPLLGPGPYRLDPTQVGNCGPVGRVAFQFVITQSWVRVCCEIPEAMDQRCQQGTVQAAGGLIMSALDLPVYQVPRGCLLNLEEYQGAISMPVQYPHTITLPSEPCPMRVRLDGFMSS